MAEDPPSAASRAAFDAGQLSVRRFSGVHAETGGLNLVAAANGLRVTAGPRITGSRWERWW